MKSLIPIFLYKSFDVINDFKLKKLYQKVKVSNETGSLIEQTRVENYLQSFGFDPLLENNPLMSKREINQQVALLDKTKIYSYAYTGGSYGEPFKLPYSKDRALLKTSSFKYFNEAAGYHLGDPFLLIAAKEKPAWLQYVRNETRFVPKDLSPTRIKQVVKTLLNKRIKVIIGFPSVVFEIAQYVVQQNIKLLVQSIIFTSEPLEDHKKAYIKDAFNCAVIDRYSNEEVGLIAQQRTLGGAYYTNRYNVLVEILNSKTLKPVEPGETGKVVVTDIAADLVPMVRYDTGDLAIAHEYKNGQLISLEKIEGRVTEQIFNTEGIPVASLSLGPKIHVPLTTEGYFNQFQFAQLNPTTYELRIKAGNKQIPDSLKNSILKNLLSSLGSDANIKLTIVEDIKPQPSGKRPIYKNEIVISQSISERK